MNKINLNQELGTRLFQEFIKYSNIKELKLNNLILYPESFQEYVEKIKENNQKLYIFLKKNILENKEIEEIEISIS